MLFGPKIVQHCMTMRRLALLLPVLALALPSCPLPLLLAAVPEQFRVWGTVGPELPAPPPGWSEETPEPEGLPALAPTAEEQRNGCVVVARDPFSEVDPGAPPAPSERATALVTFATCGEYEPITLAICALEDLRNVRVQLATLRTAAGSEIPADHLDVRLVRSVRIPTDAGAKTFRWRPFLLERRERFALAKGTTAVLWLTIKAPDQAAPGDYRGKITVQPEAKEPTTLDLQLTLLPFALPPAPVELGIYYPRPAVSDALLAQELIDVREHGLSPPIPAMEVQVESRDRTGRDIAPRLPH